MSSPASSRSTTATRRARTLLLALGGSLALAVWGTWPLAAHVRTHVYDPSGRPGALAWTIPWDIDLTLWILAWDAHALVTAPAHLFDANIFHPARRTLTASEHMLGALPLSFPLALATGDPVAAHQGTLVLSFVCAFLAALALVHDWTASWPAAIAAGALFAWSPFRASELGALQIEGNYYLPLIPLLARRAVVDDRLRWAILLALVLVLQTLHSYYLGYAAFVAMATIGAVVVGADATGRRRWHRMAVASAGALALIALATVPHLVAMRAAVRPTEPELLRLSSARPGGTGATPALVLAVLTAAWWRGGLRAKIGGGWLAALVVTALVAHVLALGPIVHGIPAPFALLVHVVPGFGRVRVPMRLNASATMALAALAGIGLAGVLRAARGRRLATVAVLALAPVAVLFAIPRAIPIRAVETRDTIPAAYGWLAGAARGPLAEVPFHDGELFPFERGEEARRMYRSVYHWDPLLNGYGGYPPPTYPAVSALARALPDPRAVELLQRTTGLRYVLLHRRELSRAERARWRTRPPGLRVYRVFGSDVVLGPTRTVAADLLPALVTPTVASATLLGTPRVPLPAAARKAEVVLADVPPTAMFAGLTRGLDVRVTNRSDVVWPALAVDGTHLVELAYGWDDERGVREASGPGGRLPYDLAPGESVVVRMAFEAPRGNGRRLTIGVVQDGVWFEGTVGPFDVRLDRAGSRPDVRCGRMRRGGAASLQISVVRPLL